MEKLQKRLWDEYQKVLIQEELLWKQKARVNWLEHGDKNTRYFHTSTMIKRKRNIIEMLSRDDGSMVTDVEQLKSMVVEFFTKLYTSSREGDAN